MGLLDTVYLNGEYLPMAEAKISPMDRGFLFGDGVYEVIPSYGKQLVGFRAHCDRLITNLEAINLDCDYTHEHWHQIAKTLLTNNQGQSLAVYFHVSRGSYSTRSHGFPENTTPTIFAFTFDIPPSRLADKRQVQGIKVKSQPDLRWKRCHIKSTSLLGNVLHFQHGQDAGAQETILFNERGELTEASSSNVFMVKNETVATPALDNQILPGITRQLLIDILKKDGVIEVEQRPLHMEEIKDADEIWLTNSSKEITPVIALDASPVGTGEVGDMWQLAQHLFNEKKFDY